MPGAQDTRPARHLVPTGQGGGCVGRLAEGYAVEVEHRVRADHQRAGVRAGDLLGGTGGLRLGELAAELVRAGPSLRRQACLDGLLVHPADGDDRFDPGGAQQREPGR